MPQTNPPPPIPEPPHQIDVAELRRLAEAATPGPWSRSGVRQKIEEDCIVVGPESGWLIAFPIGRRPKEHAGAFCDAGFVARCDPQTILSLLATADRCARLEEALNVIAWECNPEDAEWTNPVSARRYIWDRIQTVLPGTEGIPPEDHR